MTSPAVCPVEATGKESETSSIPLRLPTGRTKARKPRACCEINYNEYRPFVPSEERLFCWTSPHSISFDENLYKSLPHDAAVIQSLIRTTHEVATLRNYGAGLLRFHQFADKRGIPESQRMPASYLLLSAFVADASVNKTPGKTIGAWMSGLRAWHEINSATWAGGDEFVVHIKTATAKRGACPSRPKRRPVTLEHLFALHEGLQMTNSFDVAVWAVALCAFWGCCRLGELTIPSHNAFDERLHVAKSTHITFCRHLGGAESAQFHIPWAKMERHEGADLIFTAREDLCPVQALRAHLEASKDVPGDAPLFAFKTADLTWAPMVKDWFLKRCRDIWEPLHLDFIHGHSFRPGGATELLLAGVPPETVAKQGR